MTDELRLFQRTLPSDFGLQEPIWFHGAFSVPQKRKSTDGFGQEEKQQWDQSRDTLF